MNRYLVRCVFSFFLDAESEEDVISTVNTVVPELISNNEIISSELAEVDSIEVERIED